LLDFLATDFKAISDQGLSKHISLVIYFQ